MSSPKWRKKNIEIWTVWYFWIYTIITFILVAIILILGYFASDIFIEYFVSEISKESVNKQQLALTKSNNPWWVYSMDKTYVFYISTHLKGRLLHSKFLSALFKQKSEGPHFWLLQFGSLWCKSSTLLNQKLERLLWSSE